jgi:hypothetical protein
MWLKVRGCEISALKLISAFLYAEIPPLFQLFYNFSALFVSPELCSEET